MNGPYFSKNDLSLNNFVKALKKIADDKPHLVIFCGPFVSLDNSVIINENEIRLNENDNRSFTHHQIIEIILEKINETFSVNNQSLINYYFDPFKFEIKILVYDHKCNNMSFFTRHN